MLDNPALARQCGPMLRRAFSRIDLMVRLLILAILLASIFPAQGQARVAAQFVSDSAVFVLFLLNGMRLPRDEVMQGITDWRYLGALALWSFGIMALGGLATSHLVNGTVPPLIALGFLYLGSLPSTVQSATAYSSMAGGNVSRSVVSAAFLNLLGIGMTVPLFALMGGGDTAQLGWSGLLKVFAILLLPFAIGQMVQGQVKGWIGRHGAMVNWMDRLAVAIAVYVAFSGAVSQGIWDRLDPAGWSALAAGVALMLALGFGGAWLAGGALRLGQLTRISFLFAGAQKSTAMGAPLAMVLFRPEDAGLILMPLLVYHLAQLVISAPIATRLRAKSAAPPA